MIQNPAKSRKANLPAPDMFVPVDAGPKRRL
jgi:hypothetical protein